MGFTPAQVDAMSLWQFAAAALGHARANGAEIEDALSASEAEALGEFLDAPPVWDR